MHGQKLTFLIKFEIVESYVSENRLWIKIFYTDTKLDADTTFVGLFEQTKLFWNHEWVPKRSKY